MKYRLNLAVWFLLAAIALQTPVITYPKEDKAQQREELREKYVAAKALYEKRKREHAPKKELDKLEAAMKKARRALKKARRAQMGVSLVEQIRY